VLLKKRFPKHGDQLDLPRLHKPKDEDE